jgi:hypothetical protein
MNSFGDYKKNHDIKFILFLETNIFFIFQIFFSFGW